MKNIKIPSFNAINAMTLTDLNTEIKRLANIANTRIGNIEKYVSRTGDYKGSLLYLQKMAGLQNPTKANVSSGLAPRFTTKRAKTVQEAKHKLSLVVKTLEAKSSKVSELKKLDEKKRQTMSNLYFGDNYELSSDDFRDVVSILEKYKNAKNIDSEAIIRMYKKELEDPKFRDINEFKDFLDDVAFDTVNAIPERLYEDLEKNKKIFVKNGQINLTK